MKQYKLIQLSEPPLGGSVCDLCDLGKECEAFNRGVETDNISIIYECIFNNNNKEYIKEE